ncbi:hypothetical protein [Streptomyces sp. NPDC096068]
MEGFVSLARAFATASMARTVVAMLAVAVSKTAMAVRLKAGRWAGFSAVF